MKLKGKIFLTVIISLSMLMIFTSCNEKNMIPEEALKKFIEEIEKDKLFNMRLTIYYMSPKILTGIPLSVEDLINGDFMSKYIISGSKLKEYDELLKQVSNIKLIPVEKNSKIDARIYYVFEDSKGKKIFDVAMWGDSDSNYVNGCEFEGENVFYDILLPFLPEDEAKEFKDEQKFMNKRKQEKNKS